MRYLATSILVLAISSSPAFADELVQRSCGLLIENARQSALEELGLVTKYATQDYSNVWLSAGRHPHHYPDDADHCEGTTVGNCEHRFPGTKYRTYDFSLGVHGAYAFEIPEMVAKFKQELTGADAEMASAIHDLEVSPDKSLYADLLAQTRATLAEHISDYDSFRRIDMATGSQIDEGIDAASSDLKTEYDRDQARYRICSPANVLERTRIAGTDQPAYVAAFCATIDLATGDANYTIRFEDVASKKVRSIPGQPRYIQFLGTLVNPGMASAVYDSLLQRQLERLPLACGLTASSQSSESSRSDADVKVLAPESAGDEPAAKPSSGTRMAL